MIEDAAEAHGADYKGRRVGSLGNIATFSFYGNKILTTGEGGMAVTGDSALAQKMRLLKGQGMDPDRRYWFPMVGYNYRMTNIAAAIGLAQLEKADWHINRRREIAELYKKFLEKIPGITMQPELSWARCVYWMTSIVLDQDLSISRDEVMRRLAEEGIETRPFFYPMHSLPMYRSVSGEKTYPVADHLSAHGMNLPSYAQLSPDDIEYVCDSLTRILS